mgnify:CR=1 FL=1
MFNIDDLGNTFLKLERVRNTELREDVIKYEGDRETYLLDYYALAVDEHGGDVYKDDLGLVTIERVDCLAVHGESSGGVRCYARSVTAYKDADGSLWMDAGLHDEVFC